MFRPMTAAAILSSAIAMTAAIAQASDFATPGEAQAMEDKAIAALRANEATALAKFNRADTGFRDRDLYVLCFNTATGMITAIPDPAQLGKDFRLLAGTDGSPLGQKIYDTARSLKDGEMTVVSYNRLSPITNQPIPAGMYLAKVRNTACGVGFYK